MKGNGKKNERGVGSEGKCARDDGKGNIERVLKVKGSEFEERGKREREEAVGSEETRV